MTHEHKIGIGITCTFLCLTGAVIGLKMRDQPLPQAVSETAPEADGKNKKSSEKPQSPLFSPAAAVANVLGQENNSKKEPKAAPGVASSNSTSPSVQANAKQNETDNREKKPLILLGSDTNSLPTKPATIETKINDQAAKNGKNENNRKAEISWPPTYPAVAKNPPGGNTSSESSFQKTGGTAAAIDNSSDNSMLKPVPNPEDYFTKAIPTPALPDPVAPSQGAMASVTPIPISTNAAGPSLLTPAQSSPPPPPPPPPMQPIGSGAPSPSFVSRPGESSSPPPPPKQDWSPRTSAPLESKPATPAWQPPLGGKVQDNKPAPLVPAAVPPAPSPSPVGAKPQPEGSYFIQEPHSATNSASGTTTDSGNKSKENKPGPLPLPPSLGGADPGRPNGTGWASPGGNGAAGTRPSAPPAPQVLVYDEIDYVCQPGDTFAKISARWYQTEAFAEALKRHNQHHARASEQMAKYGTITAGEKIVIPPADILEQRYGDALVKPTAPPAGQMMPASYTSPPTPPGNLMPPPQR